MSMLQVFLAEILVLPLESLVPDFIVWVHEDSAELVKCNKPVSYTHLDVYKRQTQSSRRSKRS